MRAARPAGSPRVLVWISLKVWPTGFAAGVGVKWLGVRGRGPVRLWVLPDFKRLELLFGENSQNSLSDSSEQCCLDVQVVGLE